VVNVDRAMRWGYAWSECPFQLLDKFDPGMFLSRIVSENGKTPKKLKALHKAGADKIYLEEEGQFFALGVTYQKTPTS